VFGLGVIFTKMVSVIFKRNLLEFALIPDLIVPAFGPGEFVPDFSHKK